MAEVAFINQLTEQLTEEDKKLSLQHKQERMRSGGRLCYSVLLPWMRSGGGEDEVRREIML